jgi:hypothetical protein
MCNGRPCAGVPPVVIVPVSVIEPPGFERAFVAQLFRSFAFFGERVVDVDRLADHRFDVRRERRVAAFGGELRREEADELTAACDFGGRPDFTQLLHDRRRVTAIADGVADGRVAAVERLHVKRDREEVDGRQVGDAWVGQLDLVVARRRARRFVVFDWRVVGEVQARAGDRAERKRRIVDFTEQLRRVFLQLPIAARSLFEQQVDARRRPAGAVDDLDVDRRRGRRGEHGGRERGEDRGACARAASAARRSCPTN